MFLLSNASSEGNNLQVDMEERKNIGCTIDWLERKVLGGDLGREKMFNNNNGNNCLP